MLIHFLSNYSVIGRVGNRINIMGMFPGMQTQDFVFLNKEDKDNEEEHPYKIEDIQYNDDRNAVFKAVIAAE